MRENIGISIIILKKIFRIINFIGLQTVIIGLPLKAKIDF